ncbi:MAG: DUF2561 family protein [Euryarchaeota archaeon]|nr:DUF2561 family protein [Euryarchaeota archaeon]MDE1837478.1 DUF2561 family protein [Euryarchaeota archaeon]MDE1880566.1 DUF2561 family protein [Euryarchaeota archaeon]MDE2045556.1 DUF2561 family protein [Thermoplasmata archaeon]
MSTLVAAIAFLFLVSMGLSAGSAHASSVRPAVTGNTSWAWEQDFAYTCAMPTCGAYSNPNVTETGSAHFWAEVVIIYNEVDNGGTYSVSVEKVLRAYAGGSVSVTCNANCGSFPVGTTINGNATASAWYGAYANANFTSSSQVCAGNTAMFYMYGGAGSGCPGLYGGTSDNDTWSPALGLMNAETNQAANITAQASVSGGPFSGGSAYFSVNASFGLQAAFTPALGLVPNHLWGGPNYGGAMSAGEQWSAAANYTGSASGGFGAHMYYPCAWAQSSSGSSTVCSSSGAPPPTCTYPNPCPPYAVNNITKSYAASGAGSGSLTENGADYGPVVVNNGPGCPCTFQVITLSILGPLGMSDGVFLTPGGTTLFGLSTPAPATPVLGGLHAAVLSPALTMTPSGGLDYSSSGHNVGFSSSNTLGATSTYTGGMAPGGSSGPVAPSQAQSDANNLMSPPSASSGTPWLFMVVIVVAVVVVVAVAAVMVMRRRRAPPAAAPAPAQPQPAYGAWPPQQQAPGAPQQAPPPAYR